MSCYSIFHHVLPITLSCYVIILSIRDTLSIKKYILSIRDTSYIKKKISVKTGIDELLVSIKSIFVLIRTKQRLL